MSINLEKDPGGRPSLGVYALRVTLRPEDVDAARRLGDGQTSRGLRKALDLVRTLDGEVERLEDVAMIVWESASRLDHPGDWARVSDILHGAGLVLQNKDAGEDARFLSSLAEQRCVAAGYGLAVRPVAAHDDGDHPTHSIRM